MKTWFRNTAIALSIVFLTQPLVAQKADLNEVGKQMFIMLQNTHFARLPYNDQLSQKFLTTFLESLDSQKLYFTQDDVDRFKNEYGDRLHNLMLEADSMTPAKDIYQLFQKRVNERITFAQNLLKGEFDFTKEETFQPSRKDAAWAINLEEINENWTKQIKSAVLSEILRKEALAKLLKEKGDKKASGKDIDPIEKVSLRYKRLLASVEEVDDEDVAAYFFSAVAATYDPHTDYLSFKEMNRFKGDMKNELIGIGALLQGDEDGATTIKGIVVGGPADKGGILKLNDRVVAVDSMNTGKPEDMTDIMFLPIHKVVEMIRGKEGSSVALKVEPSGAAPGETTVIVIKRDKVELKDEQASGELIFMKDAKGVKHRIGVIILPSFYSDFDEGKTQSSVDVEKILKRLVDEKIDGLVFDLRNNGGGSLEEVRRMTGFFMPQGPVVQVKNTLGQVQVKDSDSEKPIYLGPMVVLVDKASASASEIIAGALQDFNRAVIVGETSTFGKGTVQQPMDIGQMLPLFSSRDRAGFLKVTIQKFYRPSGSSTQMDGVEPSIVFPSINDAFDFGERDMDHALEHDRIRPAANFKPSSKSNLFIEELKELSKNRIEKSADFAYVMEDVLRAKTRIKANVESLHKLKREEEIASLDKQKKERNLERKERFSKLAKEDSESFVFHKISLDQLKKKSELVAYDPNEESSEYMRRAKEEDESAEETPKWPSGLDIYKREAIYITRDFIELAKAETLLEANQNKD